MAFVSVARLDAISSGGATCVQIEGVAVGLFRVGAQVYAMENACPHAGFPLSQGELRGSVVVCAAHGWDYDVRTGFPPHSRDGFPIPCFAVELRDGEVWVDLHQRLNDPPKRRGRDV